VLSDGSLVTVTSPDGTTSTFNNDLWSAVIGGGKCWEILTLSKVVLLTSDFHCCQTASGSFGVIVDITLNSVKENDYQAYYWEVNFFYSSTDCIKSMLQEYKDMLDDGTLSTSDPRWNIWFTFAGFKSWFTPRFGGLAFNYFQLDLVWVASSSSDKDEQRAEAQAVYNRLFGAYTSTNPSSCITLDQYFEENEVQVLKESFPSTYGREGSLSELHSEVVSTVHHDIAYSCYLHYSY
jgi:hypothetical protein